MPGLQIAMIGATGAVGKNALAALLAERADVVARVTVVGRRDVGSRPDGRLISKVVDLGNDSAVGMALPDHLDVGISALGTTIKAAGSAAAFRAIDHDAVVRFAAACRSRGAKHFVVVTSLGTSPKAMGLYLRTKADVEAALSSMAFDGVSVLRPAILDDQGTRAEQRLGERVGLAVMGAVAGVIGKSHVWAPIPVSVVGRAIAALSVGATPAGVVVYPSDQLHRLGAPA